MKYLKLTLAAMLLLCLLKLPYGYYMLVRFLATVVLSIMGYTYYNEKKQELSIACGALAVLFQPFIKIALGRLTWNIIDVAVAFGLILLVVVETRNNMKH